MSVFKKFYKEIPKTDAGLAADWKGAVWKCLVPSEFADGTKGPCGDVIRCKDFTTTALRNHVRHHHPEALESVEGPAVKQGAQSTLVQMLGCASPPTSAAEATQKEKIVLAWSKSALPFQLIEKGCEICEE